jgi:hypothetical protein
VPVPPVQVQAIVDKLVAFVQKNGIQFEVRLKVTAPQQQQLCVVCCSCSQSVRCMTQVLQQVLRAVWWLQSCCHHPQTAHLLSCIPWRGVRLAVAC